MSTTNPIPVAQYLRMSTDQQRLSLEYQAAAIRRYAEAHGFTIVQTYEDPGKSGLLLKRRKGLAQLLHDVVSGNHTYSAVLVYDVSRWGRFQDTDEAAHYEFMCRCAGVPVYYCAETFENDGKPPNAIMKMLRRVMAGEYSRELSVRVYRSKKMLTERGFWAGATAGYGLRRMLVRPDGTADRLLRKGDMNNLVGGRVILVPGPPDEVAVVREIFRLAAFEKLGLRQIAKELNRRRIPYPRGRDWDWSAVLRIVRNPKYAGLSVWGRTTGILGSKRARVPRAQWITKTEAFKPLVDKKIFDDAQRALLDSTRYKSNEDLLEILRNLLSTRGRLSDEIIENSPGVPVVQTYQNRFGSIKKAYELIGYQRVEDEPKVSKEKWESRRKGDKLRRTILREARRIYSSGVRVVHNNHDIRPILCFRNGLRVVVLLCLCYRTRSGLRWRIPPIIPEEGPVTLICRRGADNESIQDFFLIPSVRAGKRLCSQNDDWLIREGKQLRHLSKLRSLAQRCESLTCS